MEVVDVPSVPKYWAYRLYEEVEELGQSILRFVAVEAPYRTPERRDKLAAEEGWNTEADASEAPFAGGPFAEAVVWSAVGNHTPLPS